MLTHVVSLQHELAGKITGMLLEMDNSELLRLSESPEAWEFKVDESIQVRKQHNALPPGIELGGCGRRGGQVSLATRQGLVPLSVVCVACILTRELLNNELIMQMIK